MLKNKSFSDKIFLLYVYIATNKNAALMGTGLKNVNVHESIDIMER